MPPRSRRSKSQSVSSANADTLVNGNMSPPSSASPVRASPIARRKRVPSTSDPAEQLVAALTTAPPPPRPSHLRFLLIVLTSVVVEIASQTAFSFISEGDLAAVSKHTESWVEAAGLLAWKVFTLGIYWYGGFDAIDVASLTVLLHSPALVLYRYFYLIHASTIGMNLISSVLSASLPFYFLRPFSPTHDPAHRHAASAPNRIITSDLATTTATTILATIIFTIALQVSFSTFLPTWLVLHFEGLRSLTFAYDLSASLLRLLVFLLPAGFASTQFLFRPSEGATSITASKYAFDPATCTFGEQIYHNTWGWYTVRQQELIGRTILLGLLLMAETIIHLWAVVAGVEAIGAVGYAAIWGAAIAANGLFLDWIGKPSDY